MQWPRLNLFNILQNSVTFQSAVRAQHQKGIQNGRQYSKWFVVYSSTEAKIVVFELSDLTFASGLSRCTVRCVECCFSRPGNQGKCNKWMLRQIVGNIVIKADLGFQDRIYSMVRITENIAIRGFAQLIHYTVFHAAS